LVLFLIKKKGVFLGLILILLMMISFVVAQEECVIYGNTCEVLNGEISIGSENYLSSCSEGIFSGPVFVNRSLEYQNIPCDSGVCADEFSCVEVF
jgi:hypothetical protein